MPAPAPMKPQKRRPPPAAAGWQEEKCVHGRDRERLRLPGRNVPSKRIRRSCSRCLVGKKSLFGVRRYPAPSRQMSGAGEYFFCRRCTVVCRCDLLSRSFGPMAKTKVESRVRYPFGCRRKYTVNRLWRIQVVDYLGEFVEFLPVALEMQLFDQPLRCHAVTEGVAVEEDGFVAGRLYRYIIVGGRGGRLVEEELGGTGISRSAADGGKERVNGVFHAVAFL